MAVASWRNATAAGTASSKGVLWPVETVDAAGLRNTYPVSEPLVPFVERYWTVQWDRTGRPPFRSEVLSHPAVNLSVESGDGARHGHQLPATLVHGVVTRRFLVDLTGIGRVCAVKFRPGGFTALTGLRVRPDSVCRAAGLLGDTWGSVQTAVLDEPDDAARTRRLDAALLALAREPEPAYLDLLGTLAEMIHDRGLTSVQAVADRAGLTKRSLQRLFRHYLAVTPKWALQRYRLQDAAALIDSGQAPELRVLANELGWFDQAHFTRDFRGAVGVTPTAYAARSRRVHLTDPPSPTDAASG